MFKENEVTFSAKDKTLKGLNTLADAVTSTLGPKGRLVALPMTYGRVITTKDGVTVSNSINLSDPVENFGAQLCKQVAQQTNDLCGDGTTQATLLAQNLVNSGMRYIAKGGSATDLKRGIDKAVDAALNGLEAQKRVVESSNLQDLEFVASIAGNDKEIGSLVAQAYNKIGEDGIVTIENGDKRENEILFREGYTFDRGYSSPYFVTNIDKLTVEFEEANVLIWEDRIVNFKELGAFLDSYLRSSTGGGIKPLLIIADEIEGDALPMLVLNAAQPNSPLYKKIVAVKAPGFGDRKQGLLEDLAALTGARFYSKDLGQKLENVNMGNLGTASKVIISQGVTTIVMDPEKAEAVEKQLASLKANFEASDSNTDKEKYTDRISKLSGKVALIKVGGSTESEVLEKRHRFEDSINATNAALQEGIVPGGGLAYLRVAKGLKKPASLTEGESVGWDIVVETLKTPVKKIASNAGFPGEVVAEKLLNSRTPTQGFDANTGEYVDLLTRGIIDPVKVTRHALLNAASIAGIFLLTDTVISEVKETK